MVIQTPILTDGCQYEMTNPLKVEDKVSLLMEWFYMRRYLRCSDLVRNQDAERVEIKPSHCKPETSRNVSVGKQVHGAARSWQVCSHFNHPADDAEDKKGHENIAT